MEKMRDPEQTRSCIAMLIMLGAYAFGFSLHNAIHEFGHSATVLAQGGAFIGAAAMIPFLPFEASLVMACAAGLTTTARWMPAALQRRVDFFRSIEPVRVRPAHPAWTRGAVLVLIAINRVVSTSPGGP